jgi:hypothetical protein
MDDETAALGLEIDIELRGKLPRGGGEVVVRGYRGVDRIGQPTTAVRVATPRGVVMAVGPLSPRDPDRSRATELLASMLPGGAFPSGTDLNGDGDPDVALRSEGGILEIWAIRLFGAAPYEIELAAPPTLAVDADSDGRIDLAGRLPPLGADPIAPDLLDIATFEGGRYTNRSAAARAFHARRAREAATSAPGSDAARLRRALERAWHALRAGQPKAEALAPLDRERAPPDLRAAFSAHRARIIAATGEEAGSTGPRPPAPASGTPAGR